MPSISVVERDYPNLYKKFTSLGPLLEKFGNGGKGMNWVTRDEVEFPGKLTHRVSDEGVSKRRPQIESAIDACEVVLPLVPETHGHGAVKAWSAAEQTSELPSIMRLMEPVFCLKKKKRT